MTPTKEGFESASDSTNKDNSYQQEYYQKNRERILENYSNDTVECPNCGRVVRRPNLNNHLKTRLCLTRQELKKLLN